MKIYLSVPLVLNRDGKKAEKISNIISNLGEEIISDWVTLKNPNPGLDERGIFERDYLAIKSCEVMLAEVSEPSIGIGMEIMLAHTLKKKIICIHQNKKISNFLKGIPNVSILSYDDIRSLEQKLENEFDMLRASL